MSTVYVDTVHVSIQHVPPLAGQTEPKSGVAEANGVKNQILGLALLNRPPTIDFMEISLAPEIEARLIQITSETGKTTNQWCRSGW
jgi:hypothetical protein